MQKRVSESHANNHPIVAIRESSSNYGGAVCGWIQAQIVEPPPASQQRACEPRQRSHQFSSCSTHFSRNTYHSHTRFRYLLFVSGSIGGSRIISEISLFAHNPQLTLRVQNLYHALCRGITGVMGLSIFWPRPTPTVPISILGSVLQIFL